MTNPMWNDHDRIWLEAPSDTPMDFWDDRTWCHDNLYEGGGVEYIKAELAQREIKALRAHNEALHRALVDMEQKLEGNGFKLSLVI